MTKKHSFEEVETSYLPVVEKYLNDFFTQMKSKGIIWNSEMSSYHFSTGGKRFRALIPVCIYQIYQQDPLNAFPLSCCLELIHNATLVHDDLQDQDILRRGKPTVWKKYSPAQAINCGDALFQFAFDSLLDLQVSAEVLRKVSRRIVQGTLQVIEGQAQEFLMKDEEFPTLNRYLEVVQGKTAALFATSVASSLESLGLDSQLCSEVEKIAIEAGILFQLQDDILDVFGEKQRERKASDIAEGKISALVACVNDLATLEEKTHIRHILQTPREDTSETQINEVIQLFEKYEVPKILISKIKKIQNLIESHSTLQENQKVQHLILELTHRFLDPIRHLL